MEIFYSPDICGDTLTLDSGESVHCVKVLRNREGDAINVVDGRGAMYECVILSAAPRGTSARIVRTHPLWHSHPYRLTMAVCPTKNNERFEWFVEKAVEIGVDRIVPVIGERSERRVFKTDRSRKIVLSAAKQSLKASFPTVYEPLDVRDFIKGTQDGARLIACCFEDGSHPRKSLPQAVGNNKDITVLIGPEGDFSPAELQVALSVGFEPVHFGESRLRTETAAVVAVAEVYSMFNR